MERLKPDYWRQLDFYNPDDDINRILVVGAGSLGSYVTFGLARLGCKNITVIDFDKVEAHNLPNQFFAESLAEPDIFKVNVLKKTIDFMMPDNSVRTIIDDITKSQEISSRVFDVIIVTVDNMVARKWIWEFYKAKRVMIIDGRIGGQFANIYTIRTTFSEAAKYYESQLFTDEEVDSIAPLPCTGKSVVDISMAVAGELVGRYRHFTHGEIINMHSFNDYKIGRSEIFRLYQSKYTSSDDLMLSADAVTAGAEKESEEDNAE